MKTLLLLSMISQANTEIFLRIPEARTPEETAMHFCRGAYKIIEAGKPRSGYKLLRFECLRTEKADVR